MAGNKLYSLSVCLSDRLASFQSNVSFVLSLLTRQVGLISAKTKKYFWAAICTFGLCVTLLEIAIKEEFRGFTLHPPDYRERTRDVT